MVYGGKPSTGCLNCRRRHIKCDETVPACKACIKTGRTCPGYKDPFDVMLRDQTAAVNKRHRPSKGRRADLSDSPSTTSLLEESSATANRALTIRQHGGMVENRSIPRVLPQPVEDIAVAFFFKSYLLYEKDPETHSGCIDMLPMTYSNTQRGSHLYLATSAVCLFCMAAWTGEHAFLRLSELSFTRAIPKTRAAVGNSRECRSDETLMTVLMLSMYEDLKAAKDFKAAQKTHLRGAAALVNNRGPDQLQSFLSRTLATAVQAQIVRESLGLSRPMVQTSNLWPLLSYIPPQTVAARLMSASSEMVNLRIAWEEANSAPFQRTRVFDIIRKGVQVDQRLAAWARSVPLHWIPIPTSNVPNSVQDAGIYRGRCDCYLDLWVASAWNAYRDARIVVQVILLRCIAMFASEAPAESAQNVLATIQALADDICASVPFYLGSQTKPAQTDLTGLEYPGVEGQPVSEAHRRAAPLLGGWFVLPYLENICCTELGLREGQLKWIREQGRRIRRLYSFGRVTV